MIKDSSYVALGSFDGIHKGHISLIDKVVELALKNNSKSVVYTFKNHPREIINPKADIKILMENDIKEKELKSRNVDIVFFEEFNETFMKFSPEEFIKNIKENFNLKGLVVGFNFRFGYKNLGDTDLLKKLAIEYNFDLYIMPPCLYEEDVISSTRIRNYLLEGKVDIASKLLGKYYMLQGPVVEGKKIGRTIGFPTANIEYNKKSILPKIGVYFTLVKVNNNIYKAITNIGNNPTVNGTKLTVESYILDFDENIYGENIQVYFLKGIRDIVKFNSLSELKNQLEKDKNFAKKEKIIYNDETYLQL